jgi:hypothetical protein
MAQKCQQQFCDLATWTSKITAIIFTISTVLDLQKKFTVEVEDSDTLPFLDGLVMKRGPEVYQKPTHTDCYLHFKSNHPHHIKRGTVHRLII